MVSSSVRSSDRPCRRCPRPAGVDEDRNTQAAGRHRREVATVIAHRNAAARIAALGDERTPAPTIAFADGLMPTLGGTAIELDGAGRNHSDNSIVLLHPDRRTLFAVDVIPIDSLPFQTPISTPTSGSHR